MRPLQIASALSWTGLERLISGSEDAEAAYAPSSCSAMYHEVKALAPSLAQAGAARQLGSRPLYVLSAGKVEAEFLAQTLLTAEQGRQFLAVKRSLGEEMASWSSQSRVEVVEDAAHGIPSEQPERVIGAVRWVVESVRAGTGP